MAAEPEIRPTDFRQLQPGEGVADRTLLSLDMSEAAERYGVPPDVVPKRIRIAAEERAFA
jgi:hypothetical protein